MQEEGELGDTEQRESKIRTNTFNNTDSQKGHFSRQSEEKKCNSETTNRMYTEVYRTEQTPNAATVQDHNPEDISIHIY